MLIFCLSTAGQFHLEMPEFLPLPSNVICEEMDESNFDPNCQHADYSIFRSWCLGNRCDAHAVKGYAKEIAEDGTIVWYSTQEQVELKIMPEDCTYESEVDGTCGYGLFPPQP